MNEYEHGWRHDRLTDEKIRGYMPAVVALLLALSLASAILTWDWIYTAAFFVGALVIAFACFRPELSLLALTIIAPLAGATFYTTYMTSLIPGTGLTFVNLVVIILVLGAFFQRYSSSKPAADATAIDKPLLLYMAWSGISVLVGMAIWGVDPPGIGEWLAMACGFMMYWVVRRRWRSHRLAIGAVWVAMSMVLLEACWVIWQYKKYGGGAYKENLKYAIVGTFPPGNSNDIATYLSVACMVALGLFLAMRWSIWRWPALAIYLIAGVATFYTYSRASYIALLAGTLSVVLFKHKRYLVPAIIGIMLLPSVLPASVMERANMSGDTSAENRKEFWKNGIKLMLTHPLGVGWRGYSKNEQAKGQKITDPHSMFVLVAAEQGIVGIVLFVGLLAAVGTETVRAIKRAKTPLAQGLGVGLFGGLIAFVVNNAFGSRMIWFYNVQQFWLLLGILAVLTRRTQEEAAAVEVEPVEATPKPVSPWRYRSYV